MFARLIIWWSLLFLIYSCGEQTYEEFTPEQCENNYLEGYKGPIVAVGDTFYANYVVKASNQNDDYILTKIYKINNM